MNHEILKTIGFCFMVVAVSAIKLVAEIENNFFQIPNLKFVFQWLIIFLILWSGFCFNELPLNRRIPRLPLFFVLSFLILFSFTTPFVLIEVGIIAPISWTVIWLTVLAQTFVVWKKEKLF